MGGFASQVQAAQTSGGKGQAPAPTQNSVAPLPSAVQNNWGPSPQPMGKGGTQTNSATSGQPRIGQQNQYSNTVGQWDNTQQQTQRSQIGGGKGKG